MEYLPEADLNGSYINESERNVHVWSSMVKACSHDSKNFFKKPTLGLIAGCYIHDGWLPVSMLYNWLDRIMRLEEPEIGNMALFRCPMDPRKVSFQVGNIACPGGPPLQNTPTSMVQEGHYMIYRYNKELNSFVPVWPQLITAKFKRRSPSPSQTCTPSPSRTLTRCCVVTGQAAVQRARGGNFTGLEVAHIFPLMGVGIPEWTATLSASTRAQVLTRQAADRPFNAILLRADVHSLFDDYQWSIWFAQGIPKIVRFEKSGATALKGCQVRNLRPSNLNTTAPCSMELLDAHLTIALLTHVRGFGKRAVAGFNATLL
ncbi:hypothetical protein JB92DRAFT_266126 [Gautieria morchelliformis]|nr:hypothetical protein JB92DRAFT_266126 [Gautieria morchelliformis]